MASNSKINKSKDISTHLREHVEAEDEAGIRHRQLAAQLQRLGQRSLLRGILEQAHVAQLVCTGIQSLILYYCILYEHAHVAQLVCR